MANPSLFLKQRDCRGARLSSLGSHGRNRRRLAKARRAFWSHPNVTNRKARFFQLIQSPLVFVLGASTISAPLQSGCRTNALRFLDRLASRPSAAPST